MMGQFKVEVRPQKEGFDVIVRLATQSGSFVRVGHAKSPSDLAGVVRKLYDEMAPGEWERQEQAALAKGQAVVGG